MKLDYWILFKLALLLFVVLLIMGWLPGGLYGLSAAMPSHRHSGEYNRAAIALLVVGLVGLGRLLKGKGWF